MTGQLPCPSSPVAALADAALAPWRDRWRLTPSGDAFATPSSVLQPVDWRGRPAFLKLATVAEEAAGSRLLAWWDGRGAAPVFAADGDAILVERATGDRDLATIAGSGPDSDDAATRILCRTADRLHAVDDRPRPHGLVSLLVWFRELFEEAAEHPAAHDGLYTHAATVAGELIAHPVADLVLHGDLHHGNVLDFGADGWLAIDPKHVAGDPGFDYANILCNPDARIALAPGRFERQLGVICTSTGVEPARMLRWAFAWAALSSCWSERSGDDAGHTLGVARLARSLLGDAAG
ncbi:aminoglycoside phosphotransferase family protein [Leifsonia lichenia]